MIEPFFNKYIISAIVVFVAVGSSLFIINERKSPEYQVQQSITDKFYNTTPRIKEKERIIIIYRDGKIEQETQILNHKGEVVKSIKKSEAITGKIKRNGEVLTSGEHLQDGDVLSEEIFEKDGKFYKRMKVLRDGKIVFEEVEIGQDEVEELILSEANGKEHVLRDGKGIREKIFMNEDGEIKKITQTLDDDGNVILEEIEDVPEILNGEIIDVEIINDNGVMKEVTKIMRNGKIITEERIVGQSQKSTQEIDITEAIEIHQPKKISLKQEERSQINEIIESTISSGEIVSYSNSGLRKGAGMKNRDIDFSAQGQLHTLATYPTDLSRKITIDKIIPATLYTEIKSHLASKTVTAQVEQDIVGSHGRKILIPAGSKAIGFYTPVTEIGAERIGVSWTRIITPEGTNISFEGETNDSEGGSGIEGKVDRRIKDKYLEAGLFSTISALMQYTVPVDDDQTKAAAEVFSNEIGGVTTELLRQSLSVMPRITIPKGTRITIRPLMDIWFKEPEGKTITAKLES